MQALLLPVGLEWYAIEITRVRETVASPALTGVPTAPPTLLGVFNLRGEIVPLFDTAALLGVKPMAVTTHAAVVETALGVAGLAVSAMPQSVELEEAVGLSEAPGTLASYALGSRLATLIDADRLLAPARIGGWDS